jgi:tetratricopeptide (TPR) repeat protein
MQAEPPEDRMAVDNKQSQVDIDRLETDFRADPANFVQLARAYIERNLPIQAIQVCKQGLRRSPQVPDGQLALAMAYYHNYDDGRAEMELKKLLRSAPDSPVAHRTLGEIYLERKQESKAVSELVRALELEPTDRHTRALLESLNEKVPALETSNGQPEVVWLPRQIHETKIPPKPLSSTLLQVGAVVLVVIGFLVWYNHHVRVLTDLRKNIDEATKLIPRDNFDDLLEAETLLNKALALDDAEERAVVNQAQVLSRLFEFHGQADRLPKLRAFQKWMVDEELLISERYSVEGLLAIQQGDPGSAVKMLTEVINRAIDKKDIFLNAEVFGVRASAYLALGNMQEAREDFSRAAKFTSSPHFQALFADVYLREGNLGRAKRYMADALRKNPDHVFANLRLALATVLTGKGLDRAAKILEALLDRDRHPEKEFSPPLLSMLYEVRGEYALANPQEGPDQARGWLEKALAASDTNAEAYNLKGLLATIAKDGAGAMAAFGRALQLDPRMPRFYFDRAESMFELDQKEEAVAKLKEFEKALKPTVAYYVKRGTLLSRMDKLDEAKAEFEAAIRTDELDPKGRFWLARMHQAMADKLPKDKENEERKRELYNMAREEFENAVMLPGGETPEVYRHMGMIYFASEAYENALDNLAKAVMMMTEAAEPSDRIAEVYVDISKIFKELGGEEGEKQERAYLMKAEGLRKGLTVEEVEQQWAEQEKKDKKKPRSRRKRRSR